MRCHKSRVVVADGNCSSGTGALSGTTITGTRGSPATVAAGGGGTEGAAGSGGIRTGLGVTSSSPGVAQPPSNVQQMPKANQNVADLFDRSMLQNLQCPGQCR